MAPEVTASETQRRAQEQLGDKGWPEEGTTVPANASEAGSEGQEQRHEGDPQVSAEELRRREQQSMRDQMQHQARLEAERIVERKLEENARREQTEREKRMLEDMDDEDYGRYVRERDSQAITRQQLEQEALAKGFQVISASTIALISDEQAREALGAKVASGEIGSWEEFFDAAAELRMKPKQEAREKELREALLNERHADESGYLAPQAGSGVPTAALDPKRMTATQKMALGWAKGPVTRK